MYLNEVKLIGNLTRDPELKALPSGSAVCNFSVATNRSWKDKESGQKKEAVEYHNCVAFNRTAEVIAQYIKKGDQILVTGRLQTRTWEKEGQKHYSTEIVVDSFDFGQKAGGRTSAPAAAGGAVDDFGDPIPQDDASQAAGEEVNPEDIPF